MWDLPALLGWVAVAAFLAAALVDATERRRAAVALATAGWVAFAAFWLSLAPGFLAAGSRLETALALAAAPVCAYTGYLLFDGRESLLALSRAAGAVGAIYLPLSTYPPATRLLVEAVAAQTHLGMELLGYRPGIRSGPLGYRNTFGFEGYTTYIVLACTGLGGISIFAGLIAAARAPLRRKLAATVLAVGAIWAVNLLRNVFVGLAAALGWFEGPAFRSLASLVAGEGARSSFVVSHHLVAQPLSVLVLVGVTVAVVRIVPELSAVVEEAAFVVTGSEHDFREVFAGAPE